METVLKMEGNMNNKLLKKEIILSGLTLIIFAISQYALRMQMFIYSDDAEVADKILKIGWRGYVKHIYHSFSGKFLTDPLGAAMGQWSFKVWALTDVVLYLLAACLVAYIIRLCLEKFDRTPSYTGTLFITCLTVMCMPVKYLVSAGFIMTSSNYVYTSIGIIITIAAVLFATHSKQKYTAKFPVVVLGIIGTVYASNQEQSACVLGGLLCGYICCYFLSYKKINKTAMLMLLADMAGLATLMLGPAHMARMKSAEGTFSIPNYQSWTIPNKITEGITTTAANIYFLPVIVFTMLVVFLFMAAVVMHRKNIRLMTAASLLLLFEIYEIVTGFKNFYYYRSYCWGLPDTGANTLDFAIIIAITVLVIYSLWNIFENKTEAAALLWLLTVGALSRIMMGFSATLFGSSFRTFIYQIVTIGCVDIYIFMRVIGCISGKHIRMLLTAGLFTTACCCYLSNYNWLVNFKAFSI